MYRLSLWRLRQTILPIHFLLNSKDTLAARYSVNLMITDLQHGRTRNPYRQELMLIEGYMTNGLSGQSDFSMTSAMSKYQSDNADMVGVFEDQRDALWHRRNAQSLVTPTLSPLMQ